MKNLHLFTLIAALFVTSCKKDDDDNQNNPPQVNSDGTLSCKVDGVSFVSKTVEINWISSGPNDKIGCTAVDSLGNQISFAVIASSPGTYTVSGLNNSVSFDDFMYEPAGGTTFFIFGPSDTATVSFSSIKNFDQPSMRISGTFSFSVKWASDSRLITEGVFSNVGW